jgi:hypothetical protein
MLTMVGFEPTTWRSQFKHLANYTTEENKFSPEISFGDNQHY